MERADWKSVTTGAHPTKMGTDVLVCIPNQRGLVLVNEVLTREGFAVTVTGDFTEFAAAEKPGKYNVIVTTAPMIDGIRRLSKLPIVNIQAFVGPRHSSDGKGQSATFDRSAFLERVRFHQYSSSRNVGRPPRRSIPAVVLTGERGT